MNPNQKILLSRKDIAELMDVTPDQVRKNEERWGLRIARRDLNKRCVRYLACVALPSLKSRGYVSHE